MTGPPDCEEAVHRLRFIFGEYCLYNAWFEAVELTTHPTRLTGSLDDTAERATLLLGHYGAVAIPAHPIASEPPWLTITRDYLRYVPASTEFYFIAPSTSYAEYWRRMPRKYRHELTRKVARFSERSHGEIDMRIYHSVAEAREFYSRASALARKTYQTRLLDAGLPQTVSFEAELLARAKRGRMRGYLLFQRGMPIAYAYCTVTGDCLRFRNIGYDPAFSGWSPGIVLIYEALRAAIGENRFAILDFGSGEAQYKRKFATGSRRCATVFFFRPTPRHLLLVAAHHACIAASDACAAMAGQLGVKQRLKKYFRSRAAGASEAGKPLGRTG